MSKQVGASKTRKCSPSKLEVPVNMVESGAMSRKKAALTYGIPRTTLIDKLSLQARFNARKKNGYRAEKLTL